MKKLSLQLQLQNKCRGFLLLEFVFSFIITISFMLLVFKGVQHVLPSWTRLTNQTSLYDVSHYIFANLEKNVGYEATSTTISKDAKHNDRLSCQTNQGDLSYIFSLENKYIYKTTKKATTSGKNPLYVSDCLVEGWKLSKINNKMLLVELTLRKNNRQETLTKVINCINGSIIINES